MADPLEALEARLRELEDREAIRDLIATYGFTADLAFDDEYVDQFVPDGEYDTGTTIYRGHEQLRDFISDPNGAHKRLAVGRGSLHTNVNAVVRVDGDSAWAEAYSVVFVRESAADFGIMIASYNHWDFARSDGRWRIVRRRKTTVGDDIQRDGTTGREVMVAFPATLHPNERWGGPESAGLQPGRR